MQGVGFIDDVDHSQVEKIVDAARRRCVDLAPIALTVGTPHVDPESIQIAVQPADAVRTLRSAIRSAIADVWGYENVPEPEAPFTPHISLGYTNRNSAGAPLRAALDTVQVSAAAATVRECHLIVLHRDDRMYEWENYATVRLGS
jgi:2'-5' RNA ligase